MNLYLEKWTTYSLLFSRGTQVLVNLIGVGNFEGGSFEAERKGKHVLELTFLHVVGKTHDKNGGNSRRYDCSCVSKMY